MRLAQPGFGGVLLLFVLTGTGCYGGDIHVQLLFEPVEDLVVSARDQVAVVTFEDTRPVDRNVIIGRWAAGLVRLDPEDQLGHGQDVGAWVADALVQQLRLAGADARRFESAAAVSGYPVVVGGSVSTLAFGMEPMLFHVAKIRAQVRIERRGLVVYDGSVEGMGKQPFFSINSQAAFEQILTEALQNWIRQVLPAVAGHTHERQ